MGYKYKAFISYRHMPFDKKVADRLQKKLEALKPGKGGSRFRVFRDETELQSDPDLGSGIEQALSDSEYLICICSKDYKESKWCMAEIEYFKKLHGGTTDGIMTLLINGTPEQSFSDSLRFAESITTDSKGNTVKTVKEIEPLAANITAESEKASLKRLDTEYLRIAATMLGCGFDDLYQRERRRRVKKYIIGAAAVFTALSAIAAVSISSAVAISSKNAQIQQQNEELEQTNKSLIVKDKENLAERSLLMYDSGDLLQAVEYAGQALSGDDDIPPVTRAEYALSKELGLYEYEKMLPAKKLVHDMNVERLECICDGKTVVSSDSSGIYFWNAETGELMHKYTVRDEIFKDYFNEYGSNALDFVITSSHGSEKTRFERYSDNYSLGTWQGSGLGYVNDKVRRKSVESTEKQEVYLTFRANHTNTVIKIDPETGDVLWQADVPTDKYLLDNAFVTDDGVFFLVHDLAGNLLYPAAGDNAYLLYIDSQTGEISRTVYINGGYEDNIFFSDTKMFASENMMCIAKDGKIYVYDINGEQAAIRKDQPTLYTDSDKVYSDHMKLVHFDDSVVVINVWGSPKYRIDIFCFDSELKDLKFMQTVYDNADEIFVKKTDKDKTNDKSDILTVVTENKVYEFDHETGRKITESDAGAKICECTAQYSGPVCVITSDGNEYLTFYNEEENYKFTLLLSEFSTDIDKAAYCNGCYVTVGRNDKTALIQKKIKNEDREQLSRTGEQNRREMITDVSRDGSKALVYEKAMISDGKGSEKYAYGLYLYDAGKKKYSAIEGVFDSDAEYSLSSFGGAVFLGDDTALAKVSTKFLLIDLDAKSAKEILDDKDINSGTVMSAGDNAFWYKKRGNSFIFIDKSGKATKFEPGDDGVILGSIFSGSQTEGDYPDCISPSPDMKKAAFGLLEDKFVRGESKYCLAVYDSESGKRTKLGESHELAEGIDIMNTFWLDNNTVGVLHSGMFIEFFSAGTGELLRRTDITGLSSLPALGMAYDERVYILGADGAFYRLDEDGAVDGSIQLDMAGSKDILSEIVESVAYASLDSMSDGCLLLRVSGAGYVIDTERFTIKYSVPDLVARGGSGENERLFIYDDSMETSAVVPYYNTSQLKKKADEYLSALE